MELGEKLYMVNRDDRKSTLEEHNFIILELSLMLRRGSMHLLYFGNVDDITISINDVLHMMSREENGVLPIRNKRSDNNYWVMANTIEEAAEKISSISRKHYHKKDDAREEIIELVKVQLDQMIRKRTDDEEYIDMLKGTLTELGHNPFQ